MGSRQSLGVDVADDHDARDDADGDDHGYTEAGSRRGDTELVTWALEEWERASNGLFRFHAYPHEGSALLRIYWLPWARGVLGETRPVLSRGGIVATVFIHPDISRAIAAARTDSVRRDVILYVVCLHEIGHALGLGDSMNEDDIMWTGGHGRDQMVYERLRRRVDSRAAIKVTSWLSNTDMARVQALYRR